MAANTAKASPTPASRLLTPGDHTLIMIDFQGQMAFATRNVDAVAGFQRRAGPAGSPGASGTCRSRLRAPAWRRPVHLSPPPPQLPAEMEP
jgi:hypothetical protein